MMLTQKVQKRRGRLHVKFDESDTDALPLREALYRYSAGKLRLCAQSDEMPTVGIPCGDALTLTAHTLQDLRSRIRTIAMALGYSAERIHDLTTAASEAAANAIVHGGGGEARLFVSDTNGIQIQIRDNGQGISSDILPRATLEPGFTTAGTLGHGFWLMLHTTDCVYLMTSNEGTTVVLEQQPITPLPHWPITQKVAA
jgi:anti-sigma regulatory factor (Ser/Thr protein kinase)